MIRVIYRWQVKSENYDQFKKIWSKATNHIHKSVSGAKGSFMLKSFEDETEILTIAKWNSLESWKNFWGNENPEQMKAMRELGKRISVEVFDEIEDYTR